MIQQVDVREKTILVGGLPEPVGGVTTFLSRLLRANLNKVSVFVDLYPASNKKIPSEYRGRMFASMTRIGAYFGLLQCLFLYRGGFNYLFNFSRLRSLLLFLVLPKFSCCRWELILHHGDITSGLHPLLARFILRRFDHVYAIGDGQMEFYRGFGVHDTRFSKISTYVPATLTSIGVETGIEFLETVHQHFECLIVASGFPRALYRHDLALRLVEQSPKCYLALFLYGEGELAEHYRRLDHPQVKVFWNESEDVFNYILSHSSLYVRPTVKDSFGIACADAISFGIPVVASAVCQRAEGVITFPVDDERAFFHITHQCVQEILCQH